LVSESFGGIVLDDGGGVAEPDSIGTGLSALDEPNMLLTEEQPARTATSKTAPVPRPTLKPPRMLTPAFVIDDDL
jgi:hypothetical protein